MEVSISYQAGLLDINTKKPSWRMDGAKLIYRSWSVYVIGFETLKRIF